MTIIASTPGEVSMYQAVVIKSAIGLYIKTGMKANRAYTPTNMLAMASKITGKQFKRGQLQQAFDAMEAWVKERKGA